MACGKGQRVRGCGRPDNGDPPAAAGCHAFAEFDRQGRGRDVIEKAEPCHLRSAFHFAPGFVCVAGARDEERAVGRLALVFLAKDRECTLDFAQIDRPLRHPRTGTATSICNMD